MNRRQLFGAAIGLAWCGGRARAYTGRGPELELRRKEALGWAKPLLVLIAADRDGGERLMQALTAASRVPDFELAARLALCDPIVAGAADLPREIARQRRLVSPVMLLIDGDAPRVAETQTLQAKDYATTLATFLRRAIPLTPAWLAPRVARLERRHPAEVREARRGMTGSAILVPSQIAAAGMLVALEAVRSDQERRRDLLGRLASAAASPVNLFAPPAPSKHSVLRPEEDTF